MKTFDDGYISGQWEAFNRVLNLLNTFENRDVAKKDIYALVSDLRPIDLNSEVFPMGRRLAFTPSPLVIANH